MRTSLLLVIGLLSLVPASPARGQVSIQFGIPGVQIGIVQPAFPRMVLVPGYPVYWDPAANGNYFFYDGLYWVFAGDAWYASDWYDGPWGWVAPEAVPLFILRVPVAYYRSPPAYFRGWHRDGPPRWGERWGNDWERRHHGWDRWDRRASPRPAPLPVYQREYAGSRYPPPQQQRALRGQHYRHEPSDPSAREVYRERERGPAGAPEPRQRERERPARPARDEGRRGERER